MTQISLVVSDVDGTLLTKDKMLTDRAKAAVQRLHKAGIGFTITSSRPAIGMRFLIEPLAIWLPVGPFNGSSIIDPEMQPVEQHLIPASAAERSLQILREFGADIWLFTSDKWLIANPSGKYVGYVSRSEGRILADISTGRLIRKEDALIDTGGKWRLRDNLLHVGDTLIADLDIDRQATGDSQFSPCSRFLAVGRRDATPDHAAQRRDAVRDSHRRRPVELRPLPAGPPPGGPPKRRPLRAHDRRASWR